MWSMSSFVAVNPFTTFWFWFCKEKTPCVVKLWSMGVMNLPRKIFDPGNVSETYLFWAPGESPPGCRVSPRIPPSVPVIPDDRAS
jgi:hypothetical protein